MVIFLGEPVSTYLLPIRAAYFCYFKEVWGFFEE